MRGAQRVAVVDRDDREIDPHRAQEATVELPLWEWGLPDDGALQAEDLLRGNAFVWRGKLQQLRIDPAVAPYRLWRLRREETS